MGPDPPKARKDGAGRKEDGDEAGDGGRGTATGMATGMVDGGE